MKLVLFFCGVVIVSGCTTNKAWVYQPVQKISGKTISQEVVIPPFIDERENRNHETYNWSGFPIVPYIEADLNVPEGKARHINSREWYNYRPTEDFAKALAAELRARNLFDNSYFSFNTKEANWVIQGYIKNTDYAGKRYFYFAGPYAPVLWVMGLPATTVRNDLTIQLVLSDTGTNEKIFSKDYSAETYKRLSWVYNTHNDFAYPDMLQEIYIKFIEDLENVL